MIRVPRWTVANDLVAVAPGAWVRDPHKEATEGLILLADRPPPISYSAPYAPRPTCVRWEAKIGRNPSLPKRLFFG